MIEYFVGAPFSFNCPCMITWYFRFGVTIRWFVDCCTICCYFFGQLLQYIDKQFNDLNFISVLLVFL